MQVKLTHLINTGH